MKAWFLSLAPRERLLVGAAAFVTLAAVFFLAVWEPLHKGAGELEQRIDSEREMAAWVAGLGAEAEALRRRAGDDIRARDDSLLSVIDRSSRDAGLADSVQRIQPEGDNQAAVTVEDAGFNEVIQWLRELERSFGVTVAALSVSRGEDDDTVQARMTLQRSTG